MNLFNYIHQTCLLRFQVILFLLKASFILLTISLLFSATCQKGRNKIQLDPLAPSRLVLASQGTGNRLDIRMSIDGYVWSTPVAVSHNGAMVQTNGSVGLFYEASFYHLYW